MRPLLLSLIAFGVLSCRVLAADSTLPPPELTEIWEPVPPIVKVSPAGIPSDAIVLFDGTNFDQWESIRGGPVGWKLADGAMIVEAKTGDIRTKQTFGDLQLHLEFRTPAEVKGTSQGRGNSGVFFMGLYELQVLDSHDNKTYVNGQAGSIYKQHPPLVNASKGPGEWQTYDAIWTAPRFSAEGKLVSPARITVLHNGVLAQRDVELRGPTVHRGTPAYQAHEPKLPLRLQDHGNPTAFRNIWVRELAPASK